jgi:CRISPR-associated endonuclease Cas2
MRHDFLIAYDITDPRRLQRLHRMLTQHALPIEYSVFYASDDPRSIKTLLSQAASLIDPRTDDLRCYPLPQRGLRARLGRATLPSGIYYSTVPPEWLDLADSSQTELC